jgi:hypothetical protein
MHDTGSFSEEAKAPKKVVETEMGVSIAPAKPGLARILNGHNLNIFSG